MRPDLGTALCRLLDELAAVATRTEDMDRQLAMWVQPGWQQQAHCVGSDPEAWFADGPGERPDPFAMRICATCPVRRSCAVSAVLHGEWGIWGGTRGVQRLHARARLRAGDPITDVLDELLAPLPSEDDLPDPAPESEPLPVHGWRAAS